MDDTVRQLMEVVRLGIEMRRAQRRYFRAEPSTSEKREALELSMTCERAFDRAAAKAIAPALDLGGGDAEQQSG